MRVARQYTGSAGKITNCQIGVFAAYVSRHGHATAKNEFGLDHNESRSWHSWHRHVSLVMLAFAMMAAIQHQANKPTPKKTKSSATPRHHPLVDPGNPPHSSTSRTKTHSNPPMTSHGRSGVALIRPQHRNLISNKNHNCNARPNQSTSAAQPSPRRYYTAPHESRRNR